MFSEKATKINEVFTVDLTLCSKCQIFCEDLSIFVAFLENMNFTKSHILKTPELSGIIPDSESQHNSNCKENSYQKPRLPYITVFTPS